MEKEDKPNIEIRIINKELPFTQIKNITIRDPRMSMDAVGLLCWLLSHSNRFKISRYGIKKHFNIGEDKLNRVLHTLRACGYLSTIPVRNNDTGRMAGWAWELNLYSDTNPLLAKFMEETG